MTAQKAAGLLVAFTLVGGAAPIGWGAEPGRLDISVQADAIVALHLVRHEDDWRFFKGTTAPQPDWHTVEDAALDAAWLSGPGGFGYGDSGIADEATNLPDMRNGYTSFFIRQEVELAASPDPDSVLQLRVDYDDGFVAYLDGVELHRENAPGTVGEPVSHNQTATGLHEASCCNSPNAPRWFDLGEIGDRLSPGRHVLAIHGLNESPGSSDFHLIADLFAAPRADVTAGRYLAISRVSQVTLTGSIDDVEITTLSINGVPTTLDADTGGWSQAVPLVEGMNRVLVEGRDAASLLVANAQQDVVRVEHETTIEGPLRGEVVWTPDSGVIVVAAPVELLANCHLRIAPGTVVLFQSGAGLTGEDAKVEIAGTAESPVYLLPADGGSLWAGMHIGGGDGGLVVRHAEIVAGSIEVETGATGIVEDCVIRDLPTSTPIIHTDEAASVEVRRCHLARFHETLFQYTLTLLEDCVLEDLPDASSDGIDFDGAPVGSTIRRCTLRHARETNSDAIDIGSGSNGVLIEGCRMYDFSDKGVSIGEESYGITVANCMIHDTGIGVEVKDGCTSVVSQSTIADCDIGFRLRIKTGSEGGHLTDSFNNILWGNAETLVLLDDSTIVAHHSLMEGLPVEGEGNREDAPRFLNPADKDYRLPADSPLRSGGANGTMMGALLPVGAPGAPTHAWLDSLASRDGKLMLRFAADPERRYVLESATSVNGDWQAEQVFLPFAGEGEVSVEVPVGPESRFFRLASKPRE